MKRCLAGIKELVIERMMPANNTPIPELVAATGISDVTLCTWRKQAKVEGIAMPAGGKYPEKWSSEDRFAIVLEAATLDKVELVEDCRQKGFYVEQIAAGKLSGEECDEILKVANSRAFCSVTPSQLVHALSGQGRYLALEFTAYLYLVFWEAGQQRHRGYGEAPQHKALSTQLRFGAGIFYGYRVWLTACFIVFAWFWISTAARSSPVKSTTVKSENGGCPIPTSTMGCGSLHRHNIVLAKPLLYLSITSKRTGKPGCAI